MKSRRLLFWEAVYAAMLHMLFMAAVALIGVLYCLRAGIL